MPRVKPGGAISTGVYDFPVPRVAMIAVLAESLSFKRVILCCFGAGSTQVHEQAIAAILLEGD